MIQNSYNQIKSAGKNALDFLGDKYIELDQGLKANR